MTYKHLPIILFVSVCLIWGTTWFAMEVAVQTIPPIFATGLRFLIAAPLLIMLAHHLKQPLFSLKEKCFGCSLSRSSISRYRLP